jgi:hypothetical protein
MGRTSVGLALGERKGVLASELARELTRWASRPFAVLAFDLNSRPFAVLAFCLVIEYTKNVRMTNCPDILYTSVSLLLAPECIKLHLASVGRCELLADT